MSLTKQCNCNGEVKMVGTYAPRIVDASSIATDDAYLEVTTSVIMRCQVCGMDYCPTVYQEFVIKKKN